MAEEDTRHVYVRPVTPYTRGGLFVPASDLSSSSFKDLEAKLLKIPVIPDVPLRISDNDISLIHYMSNHVTVRPANFPRKCLHVNTATILAAKYTTLDSSELDETKCVEIIEGEFSNPETTMLYEDLYCKCRGHAAVAQIGDGEGYLFKMLLLAMQELDVREPLKDQTGAQYLVQLVNYLSYVHKLGAICVDKGESLQTSCVAFDSDTNSVHPFNATPDFLIKARDTTIGVGEMESSPYKQMVIAGLGHIGRPYVKYLLGICLSQARSVDLYLFENSLGTKVHCNEVYKGEISIKKITTEASYPLTKVEGVKKFITKLLSTLKFIIEDYEHRVNDLGKCEVYNPDVESPALRQSKRRKM